MIFEIAHLKASMICPSWFSSSTILLMMSSKFGSFKTPVAFGSTWIVKSFKKTISDQNLNKLWVPATHSLLDWSWVVWGCLPTVLSSPDPWSRCQTFWTLPGKFQFWSPPKKTQRPDIEKSVSHWGTSLCLTLCCRPEKEKVKGKEDLSVINFAQDDTSCKCKVEGTSGWMGSHVSNWEDIKLSKRQPKGKCQSKCVKMKDTAKYRWKTVCACSKATQIPTQLMTDVDAAVAN